MGERHCLFLPTGLHRQYTLQYRIEDQAEVMLKYTPQRSADPTLPDPNQFTTVESKQACESANKLVEKCKQGPARKRKSQENAQYTPEQRAKVAKYAIENGVMKAARKFGVGESTVRNFKRKLVAMAPEELADVKTLEIKQRGRPLLLGQYDKDVCAYVQAIRRSGGIINNEIVRAGARGIIMAHNKSLLHEFGGHIVLDKAWGVSILKRLGYTKRELEQSDVNDCQDYDTLIPCEFPNFVSTFQFICA